MPFAYELLPIVVRALCGPGSSPTTPKMQAPAWKRHLGAQQRRALQFLAGTPVRCC